MKDGDPGYIAGVRSDDKHSVNIGLVNASNQSALITVSLLDPATGQVIGTTWTWALNPGQSVLKNMVDALGENAKNGTLKFELAGAGSVWAYASLVDKGTGDPIYVPADSE